MSYQDRVLSQAVLWVPESRHVELPGPERTAVNTRVWTLYPYSDPDVRPELPYQPVHNVNAFLEDYVHDWTHRQGILQYGSRVSGGKIWILVEDLQPVQRRRLR
jgi:hypothetical protein